LRFYFQAILAAVISIAVVFGATIYVQGWESERLRSDFRHSADAYHQLLSSRLRNITLELASTQRFFHGSTRVDREEFSSFVSKIVSSSDEILAISWVARIKSAQRKSFEVQNLQDGFGSQFIFDRSASDRKISGKPSPQRKEHFPILYAEPMSAMAKLIGADMAVDSRVVALLELARDEGIIVPITGFRAPNHYAEDNVSSSITLIQPVYDTAKSLKTIKARREAHLGYVVLQYDIGEAVEASLRGLDPQGFDMYVADVEGDDGSEIVYYHRSRLADATIQRLTFPELWMLKDFVYKASLDVTGRQWKLLIVPVNSFFEIRQQYQSTAVLSFGLVLSLLLFYVLYSHQRRTLDIQKTVKLRTHELEVSEAKQRAVVENIAEGIITINDRGDIETFNHAAEQMFGYSADEVVGKNVNVIVPESERTDHDAYVQQSDLKTSRIINSARDLYGQRKDGRQIPIELNVSRMMLDNELKFIGIMHDISDRIKTQEILKASMEMAERANQAKSEFLSSMSHELRTPMNAIIGFGQMLQLNAKEPLSESQNNCVNHIMKGSSHLLNLINEILDLAKIEAGKVDISTEAVSPSMVIDECMPLVLSLAESRGIKLKFPEPTQVFPKIWADHTRLKQVLLNLISNAVKYNKDQGTVTLTIEEITGGKLRFSIADTGHGIPEGKREDLFEPFNRLDADHSNIEGTGIGLVITRNLVELMDGTLDLESEVGKGSTFWVDMPLYKAPEDIAEETVEEKMEQSGLPEVHGKLLYVEDNPDNLKLMEMIVGKVGGLSMISAHTGELGVELARKKKPDVILLDINLPGINGFETIEQLRSNDTTKNIPVLALSAAATKRDIEKGEKAGFACYLTKPIIVPEVLEALRSVLNENKTL